MTQKDYFTLFIALYGAILSTVLAISQLSRLRRSLEIILKYNLWESSVELVITNVGFRAISLSTIHLSAVIIKDRKVINVDAAPFGAMFIDANANDFPFTLQDGERKTLTFREACLPFFPEGEDYYHIWVSDTAGKSYKVNKVCEFRSKQNASFFYDKKSLKKKRLIRLISRNRILFF